MDGEFNVKLSILKKILPPEEKVFYDLFEKGSNVIHDAACVYKDIIFNGMNDEKLLKAKQLKKESSAIAKETLKTLNTTFITPIDREDIQLISSLLHKGTKRIIKACIYAKTYRIENHFENMENQASNLIIAVEELKKGITLLKGAPELKTMTENHNKLNEIENKGDDILNLALDDLFSGRYDAITIIKVRDLYKDIENALDTCYSISGVLMNVILKNN